MFIGYPGCLRLTILGYTLGGVGRGEWWDGEV
jgi:hypothetical protein